MMRGLLLSLLLLIPTQGAAQEETLADIRQELSVLFVEVQRLKRELSTTGSPDVSIGGASALERIDAIERELQRLTAKTEQLEFRVDSVVRDGTNRVGDLEFRLCELEANCDIATLGDTPSLGGSEPATATTASAAPVEEDGLELALSERADFDRAKAWLDNQEFANAAAGFQTYVETYPGGPLSARAHFHRGEALEGLGQIAEAARAFLESFSGDPNGTTAPDALFRLGVSLADLGQTSEACVTLGEVTARFPGGQADADARATRLNMGCS